MRMVSHLVLAVVAVATGLVLVVQAASLQAQPSAPPLNVLLVVLDDMRWDALGAAGNPVVRTPHLDRLAAEGVRFAQARVTTSICMVSRASILTGQYMSRHGVTTFGTALAPEAFALSVPGVLRRAGYWTAHVGKYGIGRPRDADFDVLRAYEGVHWIAGEDGTRGHVTEQNTRDALDVLRARPTDRPFLLMLSFFAPHAEDRAPEQYLPQPWSAAAYDGVAIPAPLRGDRTYLEALPPFLSHDGNEGRVRFRKRFDTDARYQDYMTRYYRLITEVDAGIGRIVDELRAQDVYDRTMIVVVGDNGYFQADRGLADKWYPYDESIRVPLVIRDPRLPAARRGMTREEYALNIDVAPTIVAAAGQPVPAVMQGEDVAPMYLQASPPQWREAFFYEHPVVLGRDRIPASQAVVRRDWKYVEWPDFDHRQLFDLAADPGELRNLAGVPAHAAREAALAQQLRDWRQRAR
jgi:arylsulfatase